MSVSTSRAVAYCPEEEITIDESRFQSRPSVVKENEFTKQKDNETRREMATMLYGFVQPGTSRRILFCGIAAPGGDKQDQTQLRSSFVSQYLTMQRRLYLFYFGTAMTDVACISIKRARPSPVVITRPLHPSRSARVSIPRTLYIPTSKAGLGIPWWIPFS